MRRYARIERLALIVAALYAIRASYTRKGVWLTLRREHRALGAQPVWRILLRDPDRVLDHYRGLAEGVFC